MELGLNTNYNTRQSFGMSVLIDKSAEPIIKEQVTKMGNVANNRFWSSLREVINRQQNNENNIIIRATKHRKALAAEVVDENAETALKNYVTAQGLIHKNGSLKFLERAENRANRLREANAALSTEAKAEERHYYPGGKMPEKPKGEGLETEA